MSHCHSLRHVHSIYESPQTGAYSCLFSTFTVTLHPQPLKINFPDSLPSTQTNCISGVNTHTWAQSTYLLDSLRSIGLPRSRRQRRRRLVKRWKQYYSDTKYIKFNCLRNKVSYYSTSKKEMLVLRLHTIYIAMYIDTFKLNSSKDCKTQFSVARAKFTFDWYQHHLCGTHLLVQEAGFRRRGCSCPSGQRRGCPWRPDEALSRS